MPGGHPNFVYGDIAHAWVCQDGVVRALVKEQAGRYTAGTPIQPNGLDAPSLVGRRVRRVDGRWVLVEQQGVAA